MRSLLIGVDAGFVRDFAYADVDEADPEKSTLLETRYTCFFYPSDFSVDLRSLLHVRSS